MKFPKLLKKEKHSKREIMLLEEYEKGKVLQIDNGKDNKQHLTGK